MAGDAYFTLSIVFEDSASTEKLCFACWWTWKEFCDAHRFVIAPAFLHESLRECIGANDDEEDVWRPHLASLLKRWRVTPDRRDRLARRVSP